APRGARRCRSSARDPASPAVENSHRRDLPARLIRQRSRKPEGLLASCRTWALRTWYRATSPASWMTHTGAVSQHRELGEFLASRRAKLRPEQAGISARNRRRVPGLRRQEIAEIAGLSVEYYVRLEQGRAGNVSQAVLDAIARALQLDDDERSHLWALAHPVAGRRRPARVQRVRPRLVQILDSLDLPAVVIGRRMDILAWNRLGT